jgi:hypothetical protein
VIFFLSIFKSIYTKGYQLLLQPFYFNITLHLNYFVNIFSLLYPIKEKAKKRQKGRDRFALG